ncbi:MAG: DUF1015 family protein [Bryobacterales bacterium]|nr:DUF1015 family protein [Bryobacterales bacterium]
MPLIENPQFLCQPTFNGNSRVILAGILRLTPAGPCILPHERVIPAHTHILYHRIRQSGVQETPLLLMTSAVSLKEHRKPSAKLFQAILDQPLIVADGHHRLFLAQRLARWTGMVTAGVAILSLLDETPVIRPAHRIIHWAPKGWRRGVERRLEQSLGLAKSADGAIAVVSKQRTVYYGQGYGTADQLHAVEEAIRVSENQIQWSYEGNTERALGAIPQDAETVILLPPVSLHTLLECARTGRPLPPRSSNFDPKLPPGWLMSPVRAGSDAMRRASARFLPVDGLLA